jgi:MFS family permease
MFSQGLSLDQAPPIRVILKFFLMVPLFGLLFSLLMIIDAPNFFAMGTTSLIALHLLFVGVITMSMVGALFQMLPVLAGVVITMSERHSLIIFMLLIIGLSALFVYFSTHFTLVSMVAIVTIGVAVAYLLIIVLPKLVKEKGATVDGMKIAMFAFFVAVGFALLMLQIPITRWLSDLYTALKVSHFSLALFGWVGMLIIAVAYQVIEMFFVTPAYPKVCRDYLGITLLVTLVGKVTATLLESSLSLLFDLLIALIFLTFSIVTLRRLSQRKRPLTDITVWFWRLGMGLLFFSVVLWAIDFVTSLSPVLMIIAFGMAVLSVVFGMMYKIVPFLVWFHLTNQGFFNAPVMNEIITKVQMKRHFYLFVLAVITLFLATIYPIVTWVSGVLFALTFSLHGYNLVTAIKIYRRIHFENS